MGHDRCNATAFAALLAMLLIAAPASAEMYVCTDATGRTITSDRPPRECANLPVREMRADGSVRRVIEPPLTEEQRRERAEKARREYEAKETRRSQARRDIALMETYATEEEIEVMRQSTLAGRQAVIERSKLRLKEFEAERTRLANEAEFYANRKLPHKLERAMESNKALMQAEERVIGEMQADMTRINGRFDAELQRFRELVVAGARPLLRTSEGASR
jgi:hypothetical protein